MKPKLVEEAKKRPLLQVALDFVNFDDALKVASKVVAAGAHVIEVGTPLLKIYGIKAVDEIKNIAKNNLIVADLKTADATKLEIPPYIGKGVDGVTIMGIVDDEVIEEAISICREAKVALIADLMYVQNPVNRAFRLADLGVDVVALHVGVDVQKKRGVTAKELLREISEVSASDIVVMVAGGIKPYEVGVFTSCGARIVVIGSAITRSYDPYQATIEALNNLV
ncbi:MAG: orotidine 5'-phosphate decarboxylase / HUMPS family protein [Ignisphaera sp.]